MGGVGSTRQNRTLRTPPHLQVPFCLAGAGAADARARPAHSRALRLLPAPLLCSVTCGWGSRPSHWARATPGKLLRFCLDVLGR